MKPTTPQTRRAILGAIGLAVPVAVAGGMAGTSAATATASISPELAALLEAQQAAERAVARHHAEVYEPARERWARESEALPHTTVTIAASDSPKAPQLVWSTADATHLLFAERVARIGDRRLPDTQSARALMLAHHRRKRAKHALFASIGVCEAIECSNALGEECGRILDAILDFPAATVADLQAKLTRLVEVEYLDVNGAPETILADVTRIAAREA